MPVRTLAGPLLAALVACGPLRADDPPAPPQPPPQRTEVVVTASQGSYGEGDGTSRRLLTREEMERLPNLGDDPLRLVSQLPGATASDYSAAFHVRGGEERELLVRLDGLVLDKPFHLRGFLSTATILDPRAIAGIEVLSGGSPAPYGRLSAVIDLTTRAAADRRFVLGVSLVSLSVFGEGSFADGKGRALVSARRGFLDLALRVTDVDLDDELDPRFGDAFAKVDWVLGKGHTMTVSGLWAGDDVGFHGTTQDATSLTSDVYGSAVLRSAFSERLTSEAGLEGGRVSTDRDGTVAGGGVNGAYHDDRSLGFAGARLAVDWSASERHALKLGGALRAQRASYDHHSQRLLTDAYLLALGFPARLALDFAPAPSGTEWSVYASDRAVLAPRLTAEAGLRAEGATWSGSPRTGPARRGSSSSPGTTRRRSASSSRTRCRARPTGSRGATCRAGGTRPTPSTRAPSGGPGRAAASPRPSSSTPGGPTPSRSSSAASRRSACATGRATRRTTGSTSAPRTPSRSAAGASGPTSR